MEYDSPVGKLYLSGGSKGLVACSFEKLSCTDNKYVDQAVLELDEYFAGKRKVFSVKLDISGSSFQEQVWSALCKVPYGETSSYGGIALSIDNPKAVRAVGGANNKNPVCIIVPCHRVVNADGSIGGFGGGVWRKELLLKHEQRYK